MPSAAATRPQNVSAGHAMARSSLGAVRANKSEINPPMSHTQPAVYIVGNTQASLRAEFERDVPCFGYVVTGLIEPSSVSVGCVNAPPPPLTTQIMCGDGSAETFSPCAAPPACGGGAPGWNLA